MKLSEVSRIFLAAIFALPLMACMLPLHFLESVQNSVAPSTLPIFTDFPTKMPSPTLHLLNITQTAIVVTASAAQTSVVQTMMVLTHTVPTITPPATSTETLSPNALDLSSATRFTAPDNNFEMNIPADWDIEPVTQLNHYEFSYLGTQHMVLVQVVIDKAATIYRNLLGMDVPADSPRAALTWWQAITPANTGTQFDPIHVIRIGNRYEGQELTYIFPDPGHEGLPAIHYELWIVPLPKSGGKVIFVKLRAFQPVWDKFQPVMYQMMDSVVVKPELVSTSTPT